MNQKILIILLALSCSAIGVMAVRYRGEALHYRTLVEAAPQPAPPAEIPPPVPAPRPAFVQEAPPDAPADAEEITRLQDQVVSLQLALQARDEQVAHLQRQATNRPAPPDGPWGGRTNWLEDLKTSDPKRYEEIQKAREEARRRLDRSFAEKAAFLLKRDRTKLSEQEQAQYDQMVSLLTDTWKISEEIRASDLPREQRWELIGQVRENMRALEPLMDIERDRSFYEVGKKLGYTDSQAQAFVQQMNDLVEVTSLDSIRRTMRQGGPDGWRGGPGGGFPPGR